MKETQRIKYLLERYVEHIHSPEEGEELFNRLKNIQDPEILDEIFKKGWTESGQNNLEHMLSWEHLMQERESQVEKRTKSPGRVISLWKWGVAASLLVLIGLLWWMREVPAEFLTYQTGYGETQEIVLNDGSQVTLNANSRLVWNEDWKSTNHRVVELTGEAYFEVSHVDQSRAVIEGSEYDQSQLIPFKVVTSDLAVNVLGTAFNVLNRRGKTDVYLDNGKVKLELLDGLPGKSNTTEESNPDNRKLQTLLMAPGDMVSFSATTRDLTRVEAKNPQSFTEWKEGTLVFENVKFGVMLDRLEDIYGKEFAVSDSTLLQVPVSFGIPYENWETVTFLMELTLNINLEEDQNNIVRLEKRKG